MTNHAETAALKVLSEIADREFLAQAAVLTKQKLAEWRFDPEVANVVGLVDLGPTAGPRTALAVVYLTETDFEVADRFFDIVDHFGL